MYITLGQYYPARSWLHSIDPRAKTIFLFLYIIGLFMSRSVAGYVFCILVFAAGVRLSKVPFKLLLKGLKGVLFLIIFTVLLNVFFTSDGTIYFKAGFICITDKGLISAAKIMVRLSVLIMMSSILTLTTTYLALADAIESFLTPLKRFRVPAHDIAMMITIALRFVPTLFDELEKIKLAQMSRGASCDEGNIIQKAKSMIPLLIPLFVSSFRTADNLAMAMEARCYRGDIGRTKYNRLKYKKDDYILLGAGVLFAAAAVLIRISGV
ncbi:MAG: energy-coupling factor transporter transmembrane protein EcfT [Clostridiales bacterium]|nr:energy-coupling factor transporter transmembrane protein EcfT [Clostridiales bacterium]